MHSTPQEKNTQQKNDPLQDGEQPNRAERIIAVGGEPVLPEVGESVYLLRYWQDLGLVGMGAMGPVRLSALEVIAWQQGSGIALAPWEFSVLREMSAHYISSLRAVVRHTPRSSFNCSMLRSTTAGVMQSVSFNGP